MKSLLPAVTIEREEIKKGVDIIIMGSYARDINVCDWFNNAFHTDFTGGKIALICIHEIKGKEVIEICRKTEKYKNKMVITGAKGTRRSWLSLIRYMEDREIPIRSIEEFIRMWNLQKSEANDDTLYARAVGEEMRAKIFGTFYR